MWSALPPYLGGKRRLCPYIFRELDRILPRRHWPGLRFLDAFLGGGAVSLYAKAQGFSVLATDVAERAIVVGRAVIENSRVTLTREDILRLLAPHDSAPGRIERDYAPGTFTAAQARFVDRCLAEAAQTPCVARGALLRLLAVRVALTAHPMAQVRSGTIHRLDSGEFESITESCIPRYVAGLRLTRFDKLWELAQQLNAGVFRGDAEVRRCDIVEALPELEADVAYFDPPYAGTTAYEKEYRIIDEILEGEARPVSPFSGKSGVGLLDCVFERARHIPVWILSLNNAVVGVEELERQMRRHGREARSTAIRYQHKPSVASEEKRAANREFVVAGWDADARLLARDAAASLAAGR